MSQFKCPECGKDVKVLFSSGLCWNCHSSKKVLQNTILHENNSFFSTSNTLAKNPVIEPKYSYEHNHFYSITPRHVPFKYILSVEETSRGMDD